MASNNRSEGSPINTQPPTPVNPVSSSGAKVTVACKLPHGLVLRAWRMVPDREPVLGGGVRETSRGEAVGNPFTVRGTLAPTGAPPPILVNGYVMTHGVPKDLWDAWYRDNKDGLLVTNRLVYAYEDRTKAKDASRELRDQLTGLEPFDVGDGDGPSDPRAPRPRAELSRVAMEEDQRNRRRHEHSDFEDA